MLIAVGFVEKNQGSWIGKSPLRRREVDAMARHVGALLGPIPRETH